MNQAANARAAVAQRSKGSDDFLGSTLQGSRLSIQPEHLQRILAGLKGSRATLCLLLVVLTASAYWQVATHNFLNYDDQAFVYSNPHVYEGLNLNDFIWAFTTLNGGTSYYHPLTWLSHQLDCQLFGLKAGAHHLTNVWLHVANTILLFLLLSDLTKRTWCSFMVATLFALHPLHVETVAWIAERKSLLCTTFWLLTTLAYVSYTRNPGALRFLIILILYAAGLLSKPLAVTLPFTLLLFDYWPLDRLRLFARDGPRATQNLLVLLWTERRGAIRLVVEKLPLFALAAVASVLTVLAQEDLGAVSSLKASPFGPRLQNAAVSLVLYLRKMLWPVDLAVIYPFRVGFHWWEVGGCAVFLLSASIVAISEARRRPHLFVGWFWYIGTLIPMLGLVQVGGAAMADRYTYISLVGIFVSVVWGVTELLRGGVASRLMPIVSVLCIVICALTTSVALGYWKGSIRLFTHATNATDRNFAALQILGLAYQKQGNGAEAEDCFRKSLSINPAIAETHMALAEVLFARGDEEEAHMEYSAALKLSPASPEVHASLANLYENASAGELHDPSKACDHARRACELTHYQRREMLVLLAGAYLLNKQFREACEVAQRVKARSVSPQEVQDALSLINAIADALSRKSEPEHARIGTSK